MQALLGCSGAAVALQMPQTMRKRVSLEHVQINKPTLNFICCACFHKYCKLKPYFTVLATYDTGLSMSQRMHKCTQRIKTPHINPDAPLPPDLSQDGQQYGQHQDSRYPDAIKYGVLVSRQVQHTVSWPRLALSLPHLRLLTNSGKSRRTLICCTEEVVFALGLCSHST